MDDGSPRYEGSGSVEHRTVLAPVEVKEIEPADDWRNKQSRESASCSIATFGERHGNERAERGAKIVLK
jgi:hypothetical protein